MGISISLSSSAARLSSALSDPRQVLGGLAEALRGVTSSPALHTFSSAGTEQFGRQVRTCDDILCALLLLEGDKKDSPVHPVLQENLKNVIPESLEQLRDDLPEDMQKLLPHLLVSRRWPKELTAQERDKLLADAPHTKHDALTNFVYNYIAFFQAQIVSQIRDRETAENSARLRKLTNSTMTRDAAEEKLAVLEEAMKQAETDAGSSRFGKGLEKLNQALYRYEWGVQVPAYFAQSVFGQALLRLIPGAGLVETFKNAVRDHRMPHVPLSDLSETFQKVSSAKTFSELLGAINSAIEKNLLTPVGVIHGLMSLAGVPLLQLPVTLALAACVGAGKEAFSAWLARNVGSPSLEGPKALQELVRLSNNCETLKHYVSEIPSLLTNDSQQDPAIREARVLLKAIDEVQSSLMLLDGDEPEAVEALAAKLAVKAEQLRTQASIHPSVQFEIDILEAAKTLLENETGNPGWWREGLFVLGQSTEKWLTEKGMPRHDPLWDAPEPKERLSSEERAELREASAQRANQAAAGLVRSDAALEPATSGADQRSVVSRLMAALGLGWGFTALQDVRNADIETGLLPTSGAEQEPSPSTSLIAQSVRAAAAGGQALLASGQAMPKRAVAPVLIGGAVFLAGAVGLGRQMGWFASSSPRQDGVADGLTPTQWQIIETLSTMMHQLPDGTWASSLEVLRPIVDQASSASEVNGRSELEVAEQVALILREDMPAAADGDFGEFDAEFLGQEHTRHKRQLPDVAGGLSLIPGLEDITVLEVVDALRQYARSQDAKDQDLVFQALQKEWAADPDMAWLANAPESEQRLWLTESYAAGEHPWLGAVQQRLNSLVVAPLRQALEQQGLPGDPHDYVLSLNRTITVGDEGNLPYATNMTLLQACLRPIDAAQVISIEREGLPVSAQHQQVLMDILRQPSNRMSLPDRVERLAAQKPALLDEYVSSLGAALRRDVLEAKLKGHLTGGRDAWIKGLDIVREAMQNSPTIEVGNLEASNDASSVVLPQWLVFWRKDDPGRDDCVVLYRPNERAWSAFSDRQALFQYLNKRSAALELVGKSAQIPDALEPGSFREGVLEAAPASERPAWLRFFEGIDRQPMSPIERHLQLRPYEGHDFAQNLRRWAEQKLDWSMAQLASQATSPALPPLVEQSLAVAQQLQVYTERHVPPLREFARQAESKKLTDFFEKRGMLGENDSIDSDTIQIEFNGQLMSWTDWVLEGYREHGDNVFARSNNFIRDARISSTDPDIAANLTLVKESVQANMRGTYVGDDYVAHLKALLNPEDERYQPLHSLHVASQVLQMRLALETGKSSGHVSEADYRWMKVLLEGLPGTTGGSKAVIEGLEVNGCRIPGVVVLSRLSPLGPDRTAEVLRESFVFLPNAPYGQSLYKLDQTFLGLLKTKAFTSYLENLVLIKDREKIDAAIRGANTASFRTRLTPIGDFGSLCDQWLRDRIDDTQEMTTSKSQVIREQVLKGVRFATMLFCTGGSGGLATALCATGTGVLMGEDIGNAFRNMERGNLDAALWDVAFLGFDVMDVGQGIRVLRPAALLKLMGKAHFSSVDEAGTALQTVSRYRQGFTATGSLTGEFSRLDIDIRQLKPMTLRPGKASAGQFYEKDGTIYIQQSGRVYEAYSDDGWSTVRVRDPQRPHGQGAPVVYRKGQWQFDQGGLKGGAPTSPAKSPEELLVESGMFADEARANDYLSKFIGFPAGQELNYRQRLALDTNHWGKAPLWARDYVRAIHSFDLYGADSVRIMLALGDAHRLAAHAEMKDLKSLEIGYLGVPSAQPQLSFLKLPNLPRLEELSLHGVKFGNDKFSIGGAPELRSLEIKGTEIEELKISGSREKLQYLELSHNRKNPIVELPDELNGLERLRVYGVSSMNLPKMPRLKTIDVRSVGLVSERLSLAEMTELENVIAQDAAVMEIILSNSAKYVEIAYNPRLNTVRFPGGVPGVEELHVEGNVEMRELVLPSDMPSVRSMYLHHNSLRRLQLPDSAPQLGTLEVDDNRLSQLVLPRVHVIGELDLSVNEFRSVPDGILTMSPDQLGRARVVLDNNPLSAQVRTNLRAIVNGPGYDGPQIYFSMADGSEQHPMRPLRDAIGDWLESPGEEWAAIATEDNAADFSSFLDRLRQTVNYSDETFRGRVRELLSYLEKNRGLRDNIFPVSLCATASCEDRVSLAFNDMKKVRIAYDVRVGIYDGKPQELIDAMKGLFRMEVLERIAREKVRTLPMVDEIEVYLAYQVKLREALGLPVDTGDMRFFDVSYVTQADLEAAKERVLREEADGFGRYLANSEPMQEVLARWKPQEFEQKKEQLSDIVGDPERMEIKVVEFLNTQGAWVEGDQGAIQQAGPRVIEQLTEEAYGPLVREFLVDYDRH